MNGNEIFDGAEQVGIIYPDGLVNLFENAESRRAEIESFARTALAARPARKVIVTLSAFERDRMLEGEEI